MVEKPGLMEQINVMNEVITMLLEFLRKQLFAVVVLVAGLVGTNYLAREQKQEFGAQLAEVRTDLRKCGEARESDAFTIRQLSVDLATVKEQVRLMLLKPRRN